MSNVTIQKTNGETAAPVATRAREPFRTLRDLLHWDPFGGMSPTFGTEQAIFSPAFEIKETKDNFLFTADLPGVKESDLELRLTQNRLTISGKRESEKSEKTDTFYTYERSYGSFSRSFMLPEGVDGDHIKAELKNGVLHVELPKKPEAQAKKIAVKAT